MDKIVSGQTFLYRNDGLCSTVIEVVLKDKASGSSLNRALIDSLQRFPYLTQKLVLKDSEYYLEEDLISMIAVKTKKLRPLGSMKTGYHLMDVTYYDNKINIAFHHALCDGRGITPFIESLIYYYCQHIYHNNIDVEGVRLKGSDYYDDELVDPISKGFLNVEASNVFEVNSDGYSLPENNEANENYYRQVININKNSLLKVAKENNATPLILLSLLMSSSIKNVNGYIDKPIIASIACDLRDALDLSHTYKNCVGSIYSSFESDFSIKPLKIQASEMRESLRKQRSNDSLKSSFNKQIGLYKKLDSLETIDEKKEMMSFLSNMTIDTYVISYLGQINLGENENYIDSLHLYSSGNNGLILNMISAADVFSIDMLQSFDSREYYDEFIRQIKEMDIKFETAERETLESVKDKAYITSNFQAEKYYR